MSLPMTDPRVVTRSGWEFSVRKLVDFDVNRYLQGYDYHDGIFGFNSEVYHIKHLETGLLFCFSGYDAISNYWVYRDRPYPSRLDIEEGWGCDSPYIGKMMVQKADGVCQDIGVDWQDIGLDHLYQEMLWTENHRVVSGVPLRGFFPTPKLPDPKKRKVQEDKNANLPEAVLNFSTALYLNDGFPRKHGESVCYFSLIVTLDGWFLELTHDATSINRRNRVRQMTMHCNFEKNIVHREIIERQCNMPKKVHVGNHELPLLFHEAKQLLVAGHLVVSSALSPISTLSFVDKRDSNEYILVSNIPDSTVLLLLANSGEQICQIEEATKAKIQIVPNFTHPRRYDQSFEEQRQVYEYDESKVDVNLINGYLIGIGQVDLVDFIDWTGVECLNQSSTHPLPNALKQDYREDDGLNLESDANKQLLINIPFTQLAYLHSIIVKRPEEEGPKTVKIFSNEGLMGFSDVIDFPPIDTLVLSPENLKGQPVTLKYAMFQNVRCLTVFIEDNQSNNETTMVQKIALFGAT